jgi:hypothetical protein
VRDNAVCVLCLHLHCTYNRCNVVSCEMKIMLRKTVFLTGLVPLGILQVIIYTCPHLLTFICLSATISCDLGKVAQLM